MSDKPQNNPSPLELWDAARYEAALAHLEKLQHQIDTLRGTLPSVVAPLGRTKISKAQLFTEIKEAAVGAMEDVGALRRAWGEEETRVVLERGRESLGRDGDLSRAGEVGRWGWSEGGR